MGVITIQMKTHSRKNITDKFPDLNDCVVHHSKPEIFEMVVGRSKETMFTANCQHDDCGKIAYTAEEVVSAWNRFNPTSHTKR